jgi:hypothetical protein
MRYAVMSVRRARVKNYEPTQLYSDSNFSVFN